MVADSTLRTIRFKCPLLEKKEWVISQEKNQVFIYDFPVESNSSQSMNDKPLAAYQHEPPAFETKVIESGYRTYVAIRSSDKEWLRNTHFFTVDVNANDRDGGPVSTDKINLGGWKSSETVIFEMHGGKRLNNLTIRSFGYKDAVYK